MALAKFSGLFFIVVLGMIIGFTRSTKHSIGVIQTEGFCMAKVFNNGIPSPNPSNWEGFIPDVVNEIAKDLGFIPAYQLVSDGRYGRFEKTTGNWSGLIGQVIEKKVAFAAAPLTVTALRERHVDFTHELLDVGLVVLIKRPELLSSAGRGSGFFFGIFDTGVWTSLVAAFFVTAFLLHLNDRYNPREAQAKLSEHLAANTASASPLMQFTLLGSAFYVLSTGCFQGYQRAPRSLSGRCLSLFWWVFVSIFAATYIAGFLCALVASGSKQDNTFAYLDARDQYTIDPNMMEALVPLWISGGNTEKLMQNSTDPLFQFFYKQHAKAAEHDNRVAQLRNVSDIISLVKSANHFLGIIESPMADYHARQSHCELVVAGTLLNDKSYAFAFPDSNGLSNFTLFDDVNAAILRLRESGFIRHAYQRHFGGPFVPCGQSAPSMTSAALGLAGEELARMFRDSLPITLRTFAGPVALFLLSLLVSAAAALVDVHIYTNVERMQTQPQVLRNVPDASVDDASFGALAYSDGHRQQQPQEQSNQQESDPQLFDS